MRIGLVVHKFPPASVGGTEIYTLNLALELSRRDHDVFVFYRDNSTKTSGVVWEDREDFRACRVSRSFYGRSAHAFAQLLDTFLNPDVERSFRRFLDEVRPDLVHFQHLMLLSYRLIELARRRDLPTLLTLHDYWFLCGNSQLIWPDAQVCRGKAWGLNCARCALTRVKSPLIQMLRPIAAPVLQARDALVRRAALRADRLIAPSHFLIRQHVRWGFPAKRFTYLENGIDAESVRRYSPSPSADGPVRFAYLGSLAWQKGVRVLVEAFGGIPAEKATLRIYGDPTAFPDYAQDLQRIAEPSNTFFEGTVPNVEVGRVLAETDWVAVPSLWYENSPLVIQEAFAAGVPVLASQIGALTEKVRHGVNGLLVAPGDSQAWHEAMLSLIERPSQGESYRMQIPDPVTIRQHVDALEEIYDGVGG